MKDSLEGVVMTIIVVNFCGKKAVGTLLAGQCEVEWQVGE